MLLDQLKMVVLAKYPLCLLIFPHDAIIGNRYINELSVCNSPSIWIIVKTEAKWQSGHSALIQSL